MDRNEQSRVSPIKWYVDSDERVLRVDETNNHHLIYPAWRYKKELKLQHFRGAGGMIQRIKITTHNDLHRAVEPPVLPCTNLLNEIIKLQFPLREVDPVERLDTTLEFLGKIANREPISRYPGEYTRDAIALIDNLQRQREFIEIGRVTLLDEV